MDTPVLGNLTIIIGDEDDETTLELDKIIPIDADLSEEFARQPTLYAYVAMLAAQAEAMWFAARQETERTKAKVDRKVRGMARAMDEKVTESLVANRVLLDKDVTDAETVESNYRYQYMMVKAIVQSMDQRAQMLISLGAHLRAEADQTGMLIKDARARLDNLKQSSK